jgi:hypothetical protein
MTRRELDTTLEQAGGPAELRGGMIMAIGDGQVLTRALDRPELILGRDPRLRLHDRPPQPVAPPRPPDPRADADDPGSRLDQRHPGRWRRAPRRRAGADRSPHRLRDRALRAGDGGTERRGPGLGQWPRVAAHRRSDPGRGAGDRPRVRARAVEPAHHRRDRGRQGAGGRVRPRSVAARQGAVRGRRLRLDPADLDRERAVRPRARRLHRRHRQLRRRLRARPRRHGLPRRARRAASGDPGQAPAGDRAARDHPAGFGAPDRGRRPLPRRDSPRPGRGGGGPSLPRGSVLPPSTA